MEPVRTAIIGLGYWGPQLLRNFAGSTLCQMIAGCDLREEMLRKVSSHYPALRYVAVAEEIFNDPTIELVLIATPTRTHAALATQALECGKHVFLEKPMAKTAKEAQELVALARRNSRLLFVDHTFVFAPAVIRMAELISRGDLGELLYFDSVRINLGLIQEDANVLEDLAIHDLSILSTFLDLGSIETVTAHASKYFGSQEENAHLHLTWKNGFQGHIHVSWLSPAKIRQTIVAGTKAMLIYDDTEPSEKLRIYDKGVERDTSKPSPMLPKYRSGDIVIPALPVKETLAIEAEHVLRCIRGAETPRVPGEEGVKVLRILETAKESLSQGSTPAPLAS